MNPFENPFVDVLERAEQLLNERNAEVERLSEQVRNRDYALNRLGELKDAEIARLTEELAFFKDLVDGYRARFISDTLKGPRRAAARTPSSGLR